ncbi:hypothetical protein N8642_04630 [bacterium]|nr:hypothetical protein [bacterium]
MKLNRQTWILAAILSGVFLLGFLSGVTSSRPLKKIFPLRSTAENPIPEEFVQSFSSRMTQHLNLTEDQKGPVDEIIREMSQQFRTAQRAFIPQMTRILTEHLDKILPLLDEEQKATLERRREGIVNRSPLGRVGQASYPGGGPPNGTGRPEWRNGPPPGGRPPRDSGPPPWAQERGQQPNNLPPSESNRPQRPAME